MFNNKTRKNKIQKTTKMETERKEIKENQEMI